MRKLHLMLFYRWGYWGSKGCIVDNRKMQNSSLILSILICDILSSLLYFSNQSGWSLRDPFSLVVTISSTFLCACMFPSWYVMAVQVHLFGERLYYISTLCQPGQKPSHYMCLLKQRCVVEQLGEAFSRYWQYCHALLQPSLPTKQSRC